MSEDDCRPIGLLACLGWWIFRLRCPDCHDRVFTGHGIRCVFRGEGTGF